VDFQDFIRERSGGQGQSQEIGEEIVNCDEFAASLA
jgi:hypothetical protein